MFGVICARAIGCLTAHAVHAQFAAEPGRQRSAAVSTLYADRALCLLRLAPPAAEAALADCDAALQADPENVKVRNTCKLLAC
jgi:hypothetical protein